MKDSRRKTGFTLIELLVVIAIIALLLSILLPGLRMAKEHGKRLICGTNLRAIGQAIYLYAEKENDELPMGGYQWPAYKNRGDRTTGSNPVATYFLGHYETSVHNDTPDARLKSLLRGPTASEAEGVSNLGYLMKENLIESTPEIVYCPSNKSEFFSFKAYGGDSDWPKDSSSNQRSIRISYSYLPQAKGKKHIAGGVMAPFPNQAYKHSKMDGSRSVVMDLLKGKDLAHKSGNYTGGNVLFGDGSVAFRRDDERVLNDVDLIEAGNRGGQPELWREAMRVLER